MESFKVDDMVASDLNAKNSEDFYFAHLGMAFICATVFGDSTGDRTLAKYMIQNVGRSEDRIYMDYISTEGKMTTFMLNVRALTGLSVEDLRNFPEEQTVEEQRKIAETVLGGLRTVKPMGSLLHRAFFVGRE